MHFFRVYAAIHSTKRTNVMIRNTSQDHDIFFNSSRGHTVWQPGFVTPSPYVNPTVLSNDNFTFIRENYFFLSIYNGPSSLTCTPKLTQSFHKVCLSNSYFLLQTQLLNNNVSNNAKLFLMTHWHCFFSLNFLHKSDRGRFLLTCICLTSLRAARSSTNINLLRLLLFILYSVS